MCTPTSRPCRRCRRTSRAVTSGRSITSATWWAMRPGRTRSWRTIAEAGIAGVAGNYDSTVASDYKHCGCRYEDPQQEASVPPELRLDPAARLARDQGVPRRAALPDRPPAERRASRRAAGRAGPWDPDAQHGVLDRGPARRVLPHDGRSCRDEARRRDRLRPHAPAVAPGDRRDALREHRKRRAAQGRRLARGVRRCSTWATELRRVEFVRLEYDVEETMRAIGASGLPEELAEFLRTAGST